MGSLSYADRGGHIWTEEDKLFVGYYYDALNDVNYYMDTGMRFANVDISSPSQVVRASIKFVSKFDDGGNDVNTVLVGENADNPGCFRYDDYDDFDSRRNNTTAANVDWTGIEAWTKNETYYTPDISPILKEIIGRSDWEKGKSIVIFWKDNGSSQNAFRRPYSYEGNSDYAPILHIEYTE